MVQTVVRSGEPLSLSSHFDEGELEGPDFHGHYTVRMHVMPYAYRSDSTPGSELAHLHMYARNTLGVIKVWVLITEQSAERLTDSGGFDVNFRAVAEGDELKPISVELFRDGRWIPLTDAP